MAENTKRYCPRCRKTLADVNFYTHKDGAKAEFCKPCMTAHINNWQPETYMWVLKEMDVPYIPSIWKDILDKAVARDPKKITGMTVMGKYLSKMKLKQWNTYTYADTERLIEQEKQDQEQYGTPKEQLEEKIENMKIAYENGEISEAQLKTYIDSVAIDEPPAPSVEIYGEGEKDNPFVQNSPFEQVDIVDIGADMPEEDKLYLAMKWGRFYTAADWVYLDQLYHDFEESFDIHDPARFDTLKFICKTSLKMHQALDAGDIDSYQKLARVYDQQMKAGKFTEAQKKEEKGSEFNSYGQIVAFAEKEGGFIPRLETHTDRDIADKDLHDMKQWAKDLIEQDPAIFKQIEQYIKKREIAAEQEETKRRVAEMGEEEYTITDDDMKEYNQHIEQQQEEDVV